MSAPCRGCGHDHPRDRACPVYAPSPELIEEIRLTNMIEATLQARAKLEALAPKPKKAKRK